MTARFRRIPAAPVEVDAVQWLGEENCVEAFAFLGWDHFDGELDHSKIFVPITGGRGSTLTAYPGDWIVKDAAGEFDVMSDHMFSADFEQVMS